MKTYEADIERVRVQAENEEQAIELIYNLIVEGKVKIDLVED